MQLKNDYSGTYTGSTIIYKTKGTAEINDEEQKVTISNKVLYALTDSTCYFYAGQIDRSSTDRDKYIVNVTFHKNGTITMNSAITALKFVLENITMSVVKKDNTSDNRYENVVTTLDMTYKFTDLASNRLRSDGLVSMSQQVLK